MARPKSTFPLKDKISRREALPVTRHELKLFGEVLNERIEKESFA